MKVLDFIFKTNKKRFICYITAIIVYIALFAHIQVNNSVNIYNPRLNNHYIIVGIDKKETIYDDSLPAGVKKEYTFNLKDFDKVNNCIMFYTVHSYVDVYINEELVYSLDTDGKMATSPTSIWNYIPYDHLDNGKTVKVVVTPVFKEVIHNPVDIYLGSFYTLLFTEITRDLPELLLAACIIMTGITILVIQIYIYLTKKMKNLDNIYLAVLGILMGFWKIADIRIAPLLFYKSQNTMGYIALGALFLASVPVLLHIKNHFKRKGTWSLDLVTGISLGVAGFAWLFQVIGYKDLRETLVFAHIVMVLSVIAILTTIVVNYKRIRNDVSLRRSLFFPLIIIIGIISDLYLYYTNNSSEGLFFTLFTLLIYIIIAFIRNIRSMSRKIYIDQATHLYNKIKWNELLHDDSSIKRPYGCIAIDMNSLKTINDTYGHSAGNIVISDFANILKDSIVYNGDIYRWGGDEFVIILNRTTNYYMETLMETINKKVEEYNKIHLHKISFAYGYACSADHPEMQLKELFNIADKKMYERKKKWYEENAQTPAR